MQAAVLVDKGPSGGGMRRDEVDVFDKRHFNAVAEMAQLGLRLERRQGSQQFRKAVERLRLLLLRELPVAPVHDRGSDGERRRRAALLTEILRSADGRDAAARAAAETGLDGPTPETYRKRCGNPVRRLHESGRIGPLELAAAVEIQQAAELHLTGAAAAAIDMTQPRVDTSRRAKTSLPPALDAAPGLRRFLAWRDACEGDGLPIAAMLEVIVEGRPLRDVEAAHGMRKHGALTNVIVRGLTRYTILAGWGEETPGVDRQGRNRV